MTIEQKDWGTTETIVASDLYSRHKLSVVQCGFSSLHYHEQRANRLHVISGVVRVICCYAWRIDVHELTADNKIDVPSLVPHQFQVLESGDMVEEYWADRVGVVDVSDIVRLTRGGLLDNDKMVLLECEQIIYNPRSLLYIGTEQSD